MWWWNWGKSVDFQWAGTALQWILPTRSHGSFSWNSRVHHLCSSIRRVHSPCSPWRTDEIITVCFWATSSSQAEILRTLESCCWCGSFCCSAMWCLIFSLSSHWVPTLLILLLVKCAGNERFFFFQHFTERLRCSSICQECFSSPWISLRTGNFWDYFPHCEDQPWAEETDWSSESWNIFCSHFSSRAVEL